VGDIWCSVIKPETGSSDNQEQLIFSLLFSFSGFLRFVNCFLVNTPVYVRAYETVELG